MNKERLVELFSRVHGGTFVGIDTKTQPRVTGHMAGQITKHVTNMNVMVFQNPQWSNLINKRPHAMGLPAYEVGERPWGVRLPNMPIVEYMEDYYLEVIVLSPGKIVYRHNGLPIDKALIQGIDDRPVNMHGVVVRCYHADSIECVHINGVRHR